MILKRSKTTVVAALVGSLFLACGPSTGTGQFTVTVTTGTTPTISWDSSAGAAAGLAVSEYPATSNNMWVLSQGLSGIASGVKYGTVPAGAYEAKGAAKPLVAGQTYDVTITSTGGRSGNLQFTP